MKDFLLDILVSYPHVQIFILIMATILILNQVIFSFEKTDEGEFSQPPAP
jgi:hypothetical protein